MEAAGDGTLSPVALIDEVTEMFQSSNDAEVTRQIREMGDEIIVECDQQQKHLKELIQRMSQDVVEQSKGVQESCPENDAAIAALKEKHENAARVAEGWKKKHAAAVEQENGIVMQRHELRSRKEALDNSGMTTERSSQMLSLYANITRIKWDYDAACKGYVILSQKKDVVPFEHQPGEDAVEVAAHLWSVIGSDVAA